MAVSAEYLQNSANDWSYNPGVPTTAGVLKGYAAVPRVAFTTLSAASPAFTFPYNNYDINFLGDTVKKHEVKYDANGGTNPPTDPNKYDDRDLVTVLPKGNMTLACHLFLGWSFDENATTPDFTDGETFIITDDTTLYAVWNNVPPDVILTPPVPVCYGDEITFADYASATYGNIIFYSNDDCTTKLRRLTGKPTKTETFYAQATDGTCSSACVSITITVHPIPYVIPKTNCDK
jgi:hypothetical protein